MKRVIQFIKTSSLLCAATIFFSACMKDKITHTYQLRTPVYATLAKFRQSIKAGAAENTSAGGKIVVYGNYIFLSQPYKGIHVIDNSNPSSPKNVSFINIPGNEDLAIAGNTLYADSYSDLVVFDITDPAHAVAKNFVSNVFPDRNIYYYSNYSTINPDSINVIIDWVVKDTTVDFNPNGGPYIYPGGGVLYFSNCSNCAMAAQNLAVPKNTAPNGTNGSLSRFAITGNYLYTVSGGSLSSFNISDYFLPDKKSTVLVNWDIETIYPLKSSLFIGGSSGMYVYDAMTSPDSPVAVGQFSHARACDPVIADGNYAYVTLRDGTQCQGYSNELDIVDIRNINSGYSSLLKTYSLTHPIGLSKDGSTLFICDDKDGLKVYDATDVNNLKMIKQLKGAEAIDVIAMNGIAIVAATDGIYEYDYSDINNIHLVSKL
ncbi:MAG: hypothetical protein JST47_13255 [Bacteroidetes bacterium]|nr:hypothetical protein [Bacteroidota bacterium]MBS1974949.1 hypothetical protein [Bacteroidota bacterium]